MSSLPENEAIKGYRTRPSTRYTPNERVLWFPGTVVSQTLQFLSSYRKLEAACFWYGTRNGSESLVKAVVVPQQVNRWGNYQISAESVSAMSMATRALGLVCLAQIHSHPGVNVEHSCYDDDHVSSHKVVSIVFPKYGRWMGPWPIGLGIHEFQGDYWHLLSEADAAKRVRERLASEESSLVDLRL
jgi:hypothetical protein